MSATFCGNSSNIFINSSDLAKYLLYGTLDSQSTYYVREGDTLLTLLYNDKIVEDEEVLDAFEITEEKVETPKLIIEVIK